MQNTFVDLTNEAIAVNTKIANKFVDYGVVTSKNLTKDLSDQTEKLFKVKTVDEFVALQTNWFEKMVDQSKQATKSMLEIGNEATSSFSEIWQNFATAANVPVATNAKPVSVKKAAE